ncbi:MAG: hypothetical protein ACPH93_06640 [Candidatus Poseidoniaceae archaeon]
MAKGFQSPRGPEHMAFEFKRPTAVVLLALFVLMTMSPLATVAAAILALAANHG